MKNQCITSLLSCFVLLLCFNCKDANTKLTANHNTSPKLDDGYAVTVTIQGKAFGIHQKNLESQKATISNDSILFELWEDGNPLKLNFNLFNTDILSKGEATYKIPDANSGQVKVDLNFFNGDRDTKRMNKRILFRKGTISISKISENELKMTFDGEGSGIMEDGKTFPISGKVDVNF
ncbi:hypothetical protein ESY86_15625 [Subsaximicrobium wynnwilliamsii]|uniref:DUF4251 domain-containing protein n=1 Tax=Subsaximicrobium wynnwilliamsii TaxID=291179 RepID=A0A5C6ZDT5_9FLAO|nr:hypothetical protein [Subsaximicrobium wynnwilliamsii]TXD82097.1 hypothetical protein ESY87_15215 [Subsaximicrobium wynnwilliamsii]TXD87742.1 hypothetical protein ESY86_15625 [Subsaximicrobium wynnwilliamsii]TXE01553.1 hypothetical protein ESY88_15205 [Subsaximicrobium wynnwilliamsii]